ncbi:MAG TPA: protein phosphatase 2C domain-containing protein [Polyangiaceae bacterium]
MAVVVPRFDYRVSWGAAQDQGRMRERDEDAHLIAPELALFAVADGMGGHQAGEVAAGLAIDEVHAAIAGERSQKVIDAYVARPDLSTRRNVFRRLKRVVERANERVRKDAADNEAHLGMGTTLDIVWLAGGHAFVAHAGDSRVYLARARTMLQLTHDHAQMESLRAHGLVRSRDKQPGDALLNAVGLSDTITVDTLFVDLAKRDRLLLCTDGVHGQVGTEGELAELLREGGAEQAAQTLVRRASERGMDNATAIVIEIGDRFVRHGDADRGIAAANLEQARQSPLFLDLPPAQVLGALAASVELELEAGQAVPRLWTGDLVSYIVLDGVVVCDGERRVSTGALLFPESLVGVWAEGEPPVVEQAARLLRIRADDFQEVCRDSRLAVELYRRAATHLARLYAANQRRWRISGPPPAPVQVTEPEPASEEPSGEKG